MRFKRVVFQIHLTISVQMWMWHLLYSESVLKYLKWWWSVFLFRWVMIDIDDVFHSLIHEHHLHQGYRFISTTKSSPNTDALHFKIFDQNPAHRITNYIDHSICFQIKCQQYSTIFTVILAQFICSTKGNACQPRFCHSPMSIKHVIKLDIEYCNPSKKHCVRI